MKAKSYPDPGVVRVYTPDHRAPFVYSDVSIHVIPRVQGDSPGLVLKKADGRTVAAYGAKQWVRAERLDALWPLANPERFQ